MNRSSSLRNLFDVSGKRILVTGGSSGIGAMIARGFVENGAHVYITARNEERCREAARELAHHGHCVALPHDISTVAGVAALTRQFETHETRLDVLVNNAGTVRSEPIDDYSEESWDDVLAVNLRAPFFVTQKFLPALRAAADQNGSANVINIASVNGIRTHSKEFYSYTSSKAGLIMLTRHLARRLITENILVNAIAPGPFPSQMMAARLRDHGDEVRAANPRGRVGSTEDIAGVSLFLASRASDFIAGTTIACDGGLVELT